MYLRILQTLPADSVYTTGPSGYAESQTEAEAEDTEEVTEDETPAAAPPMSEKEALISDITQTLRCLEMNGKKPEPEAKKPPKKPKGSVLMIISRTHHLLHILLSFSSEI